MQIQNLELLTDRVSHFSWSDIKIISEVRYYIEKNKYYEDISILDLGVSINRNDKQYNAKIRFIQIEGLNVYADGGGIAIQLGLFEVVDIKEDGWCTLNYLVRDVEHEGIKFYCNAIEVISVEHVI